MQSSDRNWRGGLALAAALGAFAVFGALPGEAQAVGNQPPVAVCRSGPSVVLDQWGGATITAVMVNSGVPLMGAGTMPVLNVSILMPFSAR